MSKHDKHTNKPVATAIGVAIAGLALSGSAFSMQSLPQGYALGAAGADQGTTHHADKDSEGRCGMDTMDSDKDGRISRDEFAAAHDGDAGKFAAHDPNGDGFIDAAEMKAHHEAKAAEGKCGEGKCGEGKCGAAADKADKSEMEGKCGEGKCGAGA